MEMFLNTQRYQGAEKFLVHWTPLKGGTPVKGEGREEVGWVVVTLGGSE